MWYMWCLLLLSCALVATEAAEVAEAKLEERTEAPIPVATTRSPPRTLDRQAAELAWRSWLQSPESGNQNAPPRRITTKSLFITPLVCPKGQRLDRNGCVQILTVDKDEHERILLEKLNALFTSAPSGDVVYDYGDEDPGPLQLSIPIGLDPQAAPLQGQEPNAEAQDQQPSFVKFDKKDEKPNNDASIEAELELLKLQHSNNPNINTTSAGETGILNQNVLNNFLPFQDKPKRDSPVVNGTEKEPVKEIIDVGQKEQVYGQVNVDPVVYGTVYQNPQYDDIPTEIETTTEQTTESPTVQVNATIVHNITAEGNSSAMVSAPYNLTKVETTTEKPNDIKNNQNTQLLPKNGQQIKLNPESEYSDIGEAIKLISRYAEVTTDDSFTKDQRKSVGKDDDILGTRTKLQHRRNKPQEPLKTPSPVHILPEQKKPEPLSLFPKNEGYYRYPWSGQHSVTPPPDYPFRHLQDYWPDRTQIGGVYGAFGHENPRRHHHNYPHNYLRPHGYPDGSHSGLYLKLQDAYPGQPQGYPYRSAPHHASPMRSHNNQDLYTLLGLRHWFSSESTSKR